MDVRQCAHDDVPGLRELFGDFVATYADRDEFLAAVERLRAEGDSRRAERDAFAAEVREKHSFDARAQALSAVIREMDARRMSGETLRKRA